MGQTDDTQATHMHPAITSNNLALSRPTIVDMGWPVGGVGCERINSGGGGARV